VSTSCNAFAFAHHLAPNDAHHLAPNDNGPHSYALLNLGAGAFWVQGSSRCRIIDNVIENNVKAGVQVSHRADPIVTGNRIHSGEGGGIMVHDQARGTFARNVLENSMRAGIGVTDCAAPVFTGNTIAKNEGGGAVLTGRCSPVLASNIFTANGFVGIGMKNSARAFLDDNVILCHEGYGLLMQATCSAQLQGCTLRGNRRGVGGRLLERSARTPPPRWNSSAHRPAEKNLYTSLDLLRRPQQRPQSRRAFAAIRDTGPESRTSPRRKQTARWAG